MSRCWEFQPEDRPSFSELHANISNYLEKIAGYLEVNFNPFNGIEYSTFIVPEIKNDESLPDSEMSIEIYPPSLENSTSVNT